MNDIVERLREPILHPPLPSPAKELVGAVLDAMQSNNREAATEIEELREKIAAAKAVLPRRKNPTDPLQKLVNLAAGLLDDD